MNKQELIDKLKKQLTAPSEIDDTDFNKFYDLAINYAIYFAEQLDEPEKPVVPQFVADWYEENKDDFEWSLYNLCVDFHKRELQEDLYEWFKYIDSKPIETLVKMKLFGYEIEKEKLYTVEIPNPNEPDSGHIVLHKDEHNKVYIDWHYEDDWKLLKSLKLTESEIKEDFEWAWPFAEEVE